MSLIPVSNDCHNKLTTESFNLGPKPEPFHEDVKKCKMELKDTHTRYNKEYTLPIFIVTQNDEGIDSCHWLCPSDEAFTKVPIDLIVFSPKLGIL